MNYGTAVCKLKPFAPPKYGLVAAAGRGVEGGPGWWARDPTRCGGPVTRSSVTLDRLHPTAPCLSFCLRKIIPASHRPNLLVFEGQHWIHQRLKDDDPFRCRTLRIRLLGKLEVPGAIKMFCSGKKYLSVFKEKK